MMDDLITFIFSSIISFYLTLFIAGFCTGYFLTPN